jgi:ParB family chromosome partitioning protein
LTVLRQAAREMLANVLSCGPGYHSSGVIARYAGDAIGADEHLANMATEEFRAP